MRALPFRRIGGRIQFFPSEKRKTFSFCDPDTAEAKDLAADYLYLIVDCPTTRLAQKKLAMIRAALRNEAAEAQP